MQNYGNSAYVYLMKIRKTLQIILIFNFAKVENKKINFALFQIFQLIININSTYFHILSIEKAEKQ